MTVWKLGLWGATSTAARLNVDSLAWVAADAPGRSISTLCSVPEDRGSCTSTTSTTLLGRPSARVPRHFERSVKSFVYNTEEHYIFLVSCPRAFRGDSPARPMCLCFPRHNRSDRSNLTPCWHFIGIRSYARALRRAGTKVRRRWRCRLTRAACSVPRSRPAQPTVRGKALPSDQHQHPRTCLGTFGPAPAPAHLLSLARPSPAATPGGRGGRGKGQGTRRRALPRPRNTHARAAGAGTLVENTNCAAPPRDAHCST